MAINPIPIFATLLTASTLVAIVVNWAALSFFPKRILASAGVRLLVCMCLSVIVEIAFVLAVRRLYLPGLFEYVGDVICDPIIHLDIIPALATIAAHFVLPALLGSWLLASRWKQRNNDFGTGKA